MVVPPRKFCYNGAEHSDTIYFTQSAAICQRIKEETIPMKKISVLGDSISTFQGYTTPEGVFYDLFNTGYAEMQGVEDTWWMQVIRALGGEPEVNDSFSSTTVSSEAAADFLTTGDRYRRSSLYLSGCSDARTSALGAPDLILIYMGTNDYGYQISLPAFDRDYRLMLRKLKRNYPAAEIWCGTLLWSYCIKEEMINYYQDLPGGQAALEPYNRIIRAAARDEGCHLADMAAFGVEYAAVDCAHPHKEGMKTIAELWLRAMGR